MFVLNFFPDFKLNQPQPDDFVNVSKMFCYQKLICNVLKSIKLTACTDTVAIHEIDKHSKTMGAKAAASKDGSFLQHSGFANDPTSS